MISKTTEDIVDSYIEEIRSLVPFHVAIGGISGSALYWAHKFGEYQSITLSLLHTPIQSFADSTSGFFSIELYVLACSFFGAYLISKTSGHLNQKYLKWAAHSTDVSRLVTKTIQEGNEAIKDIPKSEIEAFVQDAAQKIKTKQGEIKKRSQASDLLLCIGFFEIAASLHGNRLDAILGLLLTISSVWIRHNITKDFVQQVLLKRAEIRFILNSLSS